MARKKGVRGRRLAAISIGNGRSGGRHSWLVQVEAILFNFGRLELVVSRVRRQESIVFGVVALLLVWLRSVVAERCARSGSFFSKSSVQRGGSGGSDPVREGTEMIADAV